MTSIEIERLLAASTGQRLCGRIYQRRDGTILTRDCPVGLRARISRVSRQLTAALAAAMALVFAGQACSLQGPVLGKLPPTTLQPVAPQSEAVMGDISLPSPTGFDLTVVASGGPVPRALVTVLDQKTGKLIARGTTDQFGKFSVMRTAAGNFKIVVEAKGYIRGSGFVSIKPYQMQSVTVGLHTATDETVIRTTGIVALPTFPNLQNPLQIIGR